MKKIFKKYKYLSGISAIVIVGIFLLASPVFASFESWAANLVAGILSAIIFGLAKIVALIITTFVYLAEYNGFIDSPAVVRGWIVVRDVGNMFFVLIFLLIAFGTILRIEAYNYKRHLPKLVLMAVLINFSKTICGLFIDFSQIVMLTFVNGFKDIGEGSLVHMFGLREVFNLRDDAGDIDFWALVGAYLLGVLYMIIALVVVAAMTVSLVMRIVMLWIYVVLSPLAFLLSAFPGGQSYSQQWWSKFSKELITGPVLAFFVWLSFVSMTYTSSGHKVLGMEKLDDEGNKITENAPDTGISQAGTRDVFVRFIIAIGMLVGGMMMAQQMGGSAGQMAGKGMGALQSGQRAISNAGKRKMQKLGESAKYGKDRLVSKASAATGIQLSSSERALAKKNRREGALSAGRVAANKSIATKAEKGGLMGNLALASSGHKGAFQMMRFGQGKRTKQAYQAKQEIANTQEKISHIQDEKATRESKEQRVAQLDSRETQAGNRISQIDKELEQGVKTGKLNFDSEEYKSLKTEQDEQKQVQSDAKTQKEALNNDLQKPKTYSEEQLGSLTSKKEAAEATLEKAQGKSTINMGNQKRAAQNEQDRKANEGIAHIDNTSELVQAVKDGLRTGNQSQVRVASKKLAKNGDYNALNKSLGLGSGQKGMTELAKILQGKGNFSQQDSLSLVSDIGGLAKNNGQLSPYGAVTMENGMWRESSNSERDAVSYHSLAGSSMESIVRKSGASALGSYSGSENSTAKWQIDRSAVAMLQGNQGQFIAALKKFGNPEIVSHLSTDANIKILQDNGLKNLADEMQMMASEKQDKNSAENIEDMVRNIVINP